MRALCFVLAISCGSPKQPVVTDDLDLPRTMTAQVQPAPVVADAATEGTTDAAERDAAMPDARVVSAEAAACDEDPVAQRACESMGANFAPRMVTPCAGGKAPDRMKAASPRCMCVDTTKPRDCAPQR